MKVVIIGFSLTGNTLIVLNRIQHSLIKSGKHSVVYFDGFEIIKNLRIRTRNSEKIKVNPTENGKIIIEKFKNELINSDVIGMGSYVNTCRPPPGVKELFDENILPGNLFQNLKYCFTCSTYGSFKNSTSDALYSYLFNKNNNIISLGSLDLRTPENVCALMPPKDKPDGWPSSNLKKIDVFSEMILKELDNPIIKNSKQKVPFLLKFYPDRAFQGVIRIIGGPISIDNNKCIRCGRCVNLCPYNALTMKEIKKEEKEEKEKEKEKKEKKEIIKEEEENDGEIKERKKEEKENNNNNNNNNKIVVYNRNECWSCCRCYNWCPVNAISVPYHNSHLREQFQSVDYKEIIHPQFSSSSSSSSSLITSSDSDKSLTPKEGKIPFQLFLIFRVLYGRKKYIIIFLIIFILTLYMFFKFY